MIEFYKIGSQWYKDSGVDKNSGLFEANIIQNELENIKCDKNVLIILNGKFYNNDEKVMLLHKMSVFELCIFIASDIIAFKDNIDIIKQCQYLLHQCPNGTVLQLPNVTITQRYSWVPELFYAYCKQTETTKDNEVIFGGGVRDNTTKIFNYLNSVPSVAYLKTETTDTRLPYKEYLKELSKHRFALVVARKEYEQLHWVTARYCEAIANDVIPICDAEYDIDNHFDAIKINENGLYNLYQYLSNSSEICKKFLKEQHQRLSCTQNNFRNLIIDIVR